MSVCDLHVVRQGQGPFLVLSHALGCDLSMWDGVAERLQQRYTILRYDHRGHGRSPVPPGQWSMEMLADDALALIEAQCDGPVHFAGLSMGGMTGQALAAKAPQRLRSLIIVNSASHYNEAAQAIWQGRMRAVREQGVCAIAEGAMQRWFTPAFRADAAGSAQVSALRERLERIPASAYEAACSAVAGIDFRASNPDIRCPTLVIGGTLDEATPLAASEAMVSQIPGAQLRTIEAAHLSAVERPAELAELIDAFISRL
ncbi:MAG: alpha/beta fold hydrolase [Betaproteobacteria bacterium]